MVVVGWDGVSCWTVSHDCCGVVIDITKGSDDERIDREDFIIDSIKG